MIDKEHIFRQLGQIGIISILSTIICYSLIFFHFRRLVENLNWNDLTAILVIYIINKINKYSLNNQADCLIEKHKL